MSLLDVLKQAGVGAVEATNPVAVQYAVVTGIGPLTVRVDQRFTLDEDFLVVPEHLTEYKVTLEQGEVLIRRGLQAGDKLMLMRVQGGQQFVVLGRVSS
ncbi:DUF2577 domain-containing protein [Paenibacillus hodogayensis]|uniref:DUF2577 domain-containing protein n=1 Tax=Paenibacillus hodogayensis TaxID=279208 RepID=A0ABV5W0Y9_9BACL